MTYQRLLESPLGQDLSFMIARARSLSSGSANRRLKELGLRVSSYSALAVACSGLGPTQREIADFLLLDPSQVVSIIDDLEERGLIERLTSPTDRRFRTVHPTPAGQEIFDTARRVTQESERDFLSALTEDEQKLLLALLQRVSFDDARTT